MARKKLDVEVYLEDVTPTRAKDMLADSTNVRSRLTLPMVSAYARTMKAKRWLVGPPLMFDGAEHLLDGFHRLHAVIEASVTAQFLVIEGLDPQMVVALDGGLRRKKSDVLRATAGVENYNRLVAGLLGGMMRMPKRANLTILNSDIEPLYDLFRPTVDWCLEVFAGHMSHHVKTAVAVAFAKAHAAEVAPDELLRYIAERYILMQFEGPHDPMRRLNLRVMASMSRCDTRMSQAALYSLSAAAIMHSINKKDSKQLKPLMEDPFQIDTPF